jgi:DNA-binding IclR family transcriptional regulator
MRDTPAHERTSKVATADKVLSVLGLFTMERPEWTVDEAAAALDLKTSTAYQYFRSLIEFGLLVGGSGGRYSVGPAVISLDRITRRNDGLIALGRAAMGKLVTPFDGEAVGLLCRSFRMQVMCIDEFVPASLPFAISYERGRPMPLFRGAASKAILAHLGARITRRLWDRQGEQIAAAGLGTDWSAFKRSLRQLRSSAALVTHGELDEGLVGISAPVFGSEGLVMGSVGVVTTEAAYVRLGARAAEVETTVAAEAHAMSERLGQT